MSDASDTVPSEDGAGSTASEAYCPECGQSFPPDHVRCPNDAARLVQLAGKPDPLIGRVFEQRYEIRSRLGEGGMGAVYRGWQLSVDREVAIKVIDPRLSGNRVVVKRFLREARLSSRLSQPSIVNVYDFGQTEDGILYIAMELLRGHTLASELAAHRALGFERAVHIAVQLCDALDGAHKQGIVHRDLKPGNVMILDDPPGRDLVKVLDFGLAKSLVGDSVSKVTHSDALLGTPLYMAPEQIAGQPTDQRVDLYALGCILHEMLSGTPAFGAATIDRVLSNHLHELAAPLPADLPPVLRELILRLIAKHPAERPQTAAEVRRALLGDATPASLFGGAARPDLAGAAARPVAHAMAPATAPVRPLPPVTPVPPVPPAPTAAGTSAPSATRERRRPRWWHGVIAVLALAAVGTAIAISLQSQRGPALPASGAAPAGTPLDAATPATSAPGDAGVGAPVTASPVDASRPGDGTSSPAAPVDARDAVSPADAARVAPVDAGRPVSRPPRRPPALPGPRPEVDAGSELDFYRSDAGP